MIDSSQAARAVGVYARTYVLQRNVRYAAERLGIDLLGEGYIHGA